MLRIQGKKKVKENPDQAKALFQLATKRLKSIERRREDEFPQFLLESYYEAIKEFICALLALQEFYPAALSLLYTFSCTAFALISSM
jgi:hypothetical protein